MVRNLFVFLLLSLSTASYAAVYQYVDEEGNVVFTDKPEKGAFERKIKEPTVIQFEKPKSLNEIVEKPAKTEIKPQEAKAAAYTVFTITSPVHDSSIKNDPGDVSIVLNIEPALQTKFGHGIKLSLDGVWQDKLYSSSNVTLNQVERGTHTVKAAIVDKAGTKIKTSSDVVFHLKRFSRHFR